MHEGHSHKISVILMGAVSETLCERCNIVITNVFLNKFLNLSLDKTGTITVGNIM